MTMKAFYSKLSTPLLLIHLDNLEREVLDAKPGVDVRAPEKIAALRSVLAKREVLVSIRIARGNHDKVAV